MIDGEHPALAWALDTYLVRDGELATEHGIRNDPKTRRTRLKRIFHCRWE